MFHFLGIVAEEDLQQGVISPSYILCQSKGQSEARSGWRVIRQDKTNPLRVMQKVIVSTLYGHEDMIDFLCSYRTRDHMHGDKHYKHQETKKYYPKGAMFWFECDKNGNPGRNAIWIMRVPVFFGDSDGGYKRLKEYQSRKKKISEILSQDPTMIEHPLSSVKPKIYR